MAPNFSQATPDRALRFSIVSAVNRRVASSNLARGANSPSPSSSVDGFHSFLSHLQPKVIKCNTGLRPSALRTTCTQRARSPWELMEVRIIRTLKRRRRSSLSSAEYYLQFLQFATPANDL